MSEKAWKVWNLVTNVLLTILVATAILLVGVRLVGLQAFTIQSGSMEPVYHTGDLLYVKDVDYRKLKENDVITFLLNENTVATHRIIAVVPDEHDPSVLRYCTKGDANEAEDKTLVHYKNIIGVPAFSIPKMGYAAKYIQNPPGIYVVICCAGVLLLLVFLSDRHSMANAKEQKFSPKDQASRGKKICRNRYEGKYARKK